MTLNQWQERLERHFADLKISRCPSSAHIFALEHGLNTAEITSLQESIGVYCRQSSPASRHWLVWVVYATEVGYSYSGDEYWQTFSERTPGWEFHNQNTARDAIRDAFWRFRKEYLGVEPTGRWAKHFSIICWPITHAILPQDLQRQLAEVLFDIRHEYDQELLSTPGELGACIEGASWKSTARFQQFAEQHVLVGQIASALLSSERDKEKGLILPQTLKRIADDLDRERGAREWLSHARTHASTVRVTGFSRGNVSRYAGENAGEETPREQLIRLGVEPSLSLRRIAKAEWEVRLHLPSFSPLLLKFPNFKAFLAGERCHVAGAKDRRPIPREGLLCGTQDVILSKWPSDGEVLVRFERSCPELDYLLHTECLIRPGPEWLFKIGEDGLATEIKTGTIRPDTEYILLGKAKPALLDITAEPIAISCSGIQGVLIRVPRTISPKATREFERHELSVASSLKCWPVGVVPAKWDDEGAAEYLTATNPCIAIAQDFQSDGIVVKLFGPSDASLQLPGTSACEPVLLELGNLAPGSHTLNVITTHNQRPITATLSIVVRDPLPPSTPVGAMSVLMSPSNATLEQLWDGTATVELYAPEKARISCEAQLYKDNRCEKKIVSRQFGPLSAPISSEEFGTAFDGVRNATQNAYDEANCCVLRFSSSQLGDYSVRCERDPRLCRWAVKRENQSYWLHLIQSDSIATPKFLYSQFCKPDELSSLSASQFENRYRVPEVGGLYYAGINDASCAVVIPPIVRSLQELKLHGLKIGRKRSEQDISQVLKAIELWNTARIVGDPFSASRKQEVLSILDIWLAWALCGDEWGERYTDSATDRVAAAKLRVERRFPLLRAALSRIKRDIESFPIINAAEVLARQIKNHGFVPDLSLAKAHGMSSLQWLIEFGIRVFAESGEVRQWAEQEFTSGLHYLFTQRSLAQLCRYTALVRRMSSSHSVDGVHT